MSDYKPMRGPRKPPPLPRIDLDAPVREWREVPWSDIRRGDTVAHYGLVRDVALGDSYSDAAACVMVWSGTYDAPTEHYASDSVLAFVVKP